jgi:hypothetical protein
MSENFLRSLIAVVSGNLIYFFALWPILPPAGRHRPQQIDLGLVLDFWICLVVYATLNLLWRKRGTQSKS